MRLALLTILLLTSPAVAVDNTMVHSGVKEIDFQQTPVIGEAITPGVEPGVVISPPTGQGEIIPGYRIRSKKIAYIVGVSCSEDLTDDCSAYPYADDYRERSLYIRYIQTSDKHFKTPEGSQAGDSWEQTTNRIQGNKPIYTGDDCCVRLPSGWNACIDLMSAKKKFDVAAKRLLPIKTAPIDFFYRTAK